ncbi:MAG: MFS transporter [Chloroflexota bacterium]
MTQKQIHSTTNTETKEIPDSLPQNGAFDILRIPGFTWFLTGATLTSAAYWLQQVTLNWLVYDLTSSGALLGTLDLARSIATVGLSPIAGVAIDRLPQRRLLYFTNIWLLSISFVFGLALLNNPGVIWPLFLFSFLGGIGQAFSEPLRQTVLLSVTPRLWVASGVALVQTGWAIMRSIGPALGGFLILWFGPAGNFFVQAIAYTLVIFTIYKLKLPYEQQRTEYAKSRGNFREGWAFVISHPTTRAFLIMSWVLPIFIIPNFNALLPIYASEVFTGGPDILGLLLSAIGIGGIAGGFVATSLGHFERRGMLQLGSLLLLSLSLLAFAFSTELWMGFLYLSLAGFFEMICLTTNMTLLQLSIPVALRGRVMAIVSLNAGLMPVGAFIAGLGADFLGPRTMTIILSGIAGAIAMIVFLASSTIREYSMGQALE